MLELLSLFTGYGGFDIPAEDLGMRTVGFSEIDKRACDLLRYRFPKIKNYGDIDKIIIEKLPDFDILVGGFPCQSYSIAGKRGGLEDLRGQLIHPTIRILQIKKPKWFVLENVKGLLNHDGGKSAGLIFNLLRESGYAVDERVLNTKEFGLPQNRERVFIVGVREEDCGTLADFWHFDFPEPPKTPCRLSDLLEDEVDEKYYLKEEIQKKLKLDFKSISSISNSNLIELTKNVAQANRVYDPDGVSTTLSALGGGLGAKTGLYSVKSVGQVSSENSQAGKVYDIEGISPTICAGTHGYAMGNIAIPILTPDRVKKRQNGRRFKTDGEPSFTLTAQDRHGVYDGIRVRRLTPTECARLQGLSDDWLDIGIGTNKQGAMAEYKLSDSAKYKLAGNGVSLPVVKAILEKIKNS